MGGGEVSSCEYLFANFCFLNFFHVLATPPLSLRKFLPPPSCSSVVGNFLLWNAMMALWSHTYPIVIELGEGVPE